MKIILLWFGCPLTLFPRFRSEHFLVDVDVHILKQGHGVLTKSFTTTKMNRVN